MLGDPAVQTVLQSRTPASRSLRRIGTPMPGAITSGKWPHAKLRYVNLYSFSFSVVVAKLGCIRGKMTRV